MKKKKRIFAGAPSEQAKQTKKEVLSSKCLRTQHDKADRQTKLFKAADGIIAALKKRSALPVHANKPRAAFTLAEVLITLTIIGVVSALTIPVLNQSTRDKELTAGAKKAYSILSQFVSLYQADNGSPLLPADMGLRQLYGIMKKYIVNIKECDYAGTSGGSCITMANLPSIYRNYSNTAGMTNFAGFFDDGQYILADGMNLFINDHANIILFTVDVNGSNKKPNQLGKDLLMFQLTENGALLPMGSSGTYYEDDSKYCSNTAANVENGAGCTIKVLQK